MIDSRVDLNRKIIALQKLVGVLSRFPMSDDAFLAMVDAFNETLAEDVEEACNWLIKNESILPTPSQILKGIHNGQFRHHERIQVVLTEEQRIASYWKDDMNDCGINNEEEYQLFIKRWEDEHPGLSYYDEVVKRGY